ncbi:hypothetical protein Avbf_01431, partial [Armadillidium vulgare]
RIRFPEGTYPTGEAQATTEELAESEVGTPQYEGGVKPPKFREDWSDLNETAEKLKADGFNVEVNRVGYGDVLCNFPFK